MTMQLLAELFRYAGPFLIPVIVFAAGLGGYLLLWAYYQWDGSSD